MAWSPPSTNIASGEYPVSRSLYFYVKNAHVASIPGMKEYLAEFTSEKAFGEYGYLADKGLIPAPKAEREKFRAGALSTLTNARGPAAGGVRRRVSDVTARGPA